MCQRTVCPAPPLTPTRPSPQSGLRERLEEIMPVEQAKFKKLKADYGKPNGRSSMLADTAAPPLAAHARAPPLYASHSSSPPTFLRAQVSVRWVR